MLIIFSCLYTLTSFFQFFSSRMISSSVTLPSPLARWSLFRSQELFSTKIESFLKENPKILSKNSRNSRCAFGCTYKPSKIFSLNSAPKLYLLMTSTPYLRQKVAVTRKTMTLLMRISMVDGGFFLTKLKKTTNNYKLFRFCKLKFFSNYST